MPQTDSTLTRDYSRLQQVRDARAQKAQDYFATVAGSWDSIRSLYVPQAQVEQKLIELVGDEPVDELVDIGTGTGRILKLLAASVGRGVGIDLNNDMLALARSNLEGADYAHIHVRKGDMYRLPLEDASVDLVVVHMVLHYSDHPCEVIAEAARVLAPGGRLLLIDFAAHSEEKLRSEYKHHRLGFSDEEIGQCLKLCGYEDDVVSEQLVGEPLTVKFWQARRQGRLHRLKPVSNKAKK